MKKSLITIIAILTFLSGYSQFNESGQSFGLQFSANSISNAYYRTDVNGNALVSYDDWFLFPNFDYRIHVVTDNILLTIDGSSIPYLLGTIYLTATEREPFIGKLRKAEENLGEGARGYGYNLPLVQFGLAFGSEPFYLGMDVDFGALGTDFVEGGATQNHTWYLGFGGAAYYISEHIRSSLRIDRAWGENRKGFMIAVEAEYCFFEYLYTGIFYKYIKLGKSSDMNRLFANTIGVKMGVYL